MSHTTERMKEIAGKISKEITEHGKTLGVDECIVDDFGRFGNFSLLCYLDMDRRFHNQVWNFTSKNFKLMPIVLLIKRIIKQYEKEGAKLRSHYSPEGIYQSNSCGGMRFKPTFLGYHEKYITIDLDFIPYHAESNTFAVQTQTNEKGQLKMF
jgi:hypothetical protein